VSLVQAALVERIDRLTREKIAPRATEYDLAGANPVESWRDLWREGFLGGAGTFFGPFVGAATFLILADRLSLFIETWPLVIGVIFMAFVLFLPRGIWGTLVARGVER